MTKVPVTIQLPASKSVSNRLLILRELSQTDFEIKNLSRANDTRVLIKLLEELRSGRTTLNVHDAGTACRFIIALCASKKNGIYDVHGTGRMHERPQTELFSSLRQMGASIQCMENEGYLPIRIESKGLHHAKVSLSGQVSSQFISALCMIAPTIPNGLVLHMEGIPVSKPYITMTLRLMESFGINSQRTEHVITIPQQQYKTIPVTVESDWSSAGFFYAAMIIKPDLNILLYGLQVSALQADEAIVPLAEKFGITTIIQSTGIELKYNNCVDPPKEVDFTDCPDLALPLMVAFAIKHPGITICGVKHLKYKESDRIHAMKTELAKTGIQFNYEEGRITFKGHVEMKPELHFSSYHDHRVIMSLNLFRLTGVKTTFDEIVSVEKSFPEYFQEFDKLLPLS